MRHSKFIDSSASCNALSVSRKDGMVLYTSDCFPSLEDHELQYCYLVKLVRIII